MDRFVMKCFVTDTEKKEIQKLANSCSMSISKYIRHRAMGYKPHSTLDAEKVLELLKINADLGRLGGLLKMWLTNHEKLKLYDKKSVEKTIEKVLEKINSNQDNIKDILKSLKM